MNAEKTLSTETTVRARDLICGELTGAILGAFFEVCNELGYGFLEVALVLNFGPQATFRRVVRSSPKK